MASSRTGMPLSRTRDEGEVAPRVCAFVDSPVRVSELVLSCFRVVSNLFHAVRYAALVLGNVVSGLWERRTSVLTPSYLPMLEHKGGVKTERRRKTMLGAKRLEVSSDFDPAFIGFVLDKKAAGIDRAAHTCHRAHDPKR